MIAWQLHGGGLTASHLFQGQLLRTPLPVFAVELGYIEFFFFLFFLFSHIPPSPLGGKWITSGLPETASRR